MDTTIFDADDARDMLRNTCADHVLLDELAEAVLDLSERDERTLMGALRGRDTTEADAAIARVMRAVFDRLVARDMEMYYARQEAEDDLCEGGWK